MFADVLGWGTHDTVDNVTEEADISLSVVSYAVYEVCHGFLKLYDVNRVFTF